MYCKICGDENSLVKPKRFWQPDDGWTFGRLCKWCNEDYGKKKPSPNDFAFKEKNSYGDLDEYIDAFCG